MPRWLRNAVSIGLYSLALCAVCKTSTSISQDVSGQVNSSRKKLYLMRIARNENCTIGILAVGAGYDSLRGYRNTTDTQTGQSRLYGKSSDPFIPTAIFATMEPPYRGWKPRSIPAGTYVVELLPALKHGQPRLHLRAVEGFSSVYIEVGNSPIDTKGCILVGLSAEGSRLRDSRKAFTLLLAQLQGAEQIQITISDVPQTSKPIRNPIRNDILPPLHFPPIRP